MPGAAVRAHLAVHLLLDDVSLGAYSRWSWPLFPVRCELHTFHDDDKALLLQATVALKKNVRRLSAVSLAITVGSTIPSASSARE